MKRTLKILAGAAGTLALVAVTTLVAAHPGGPGAAQGGMGGMGGMGMMQGGMGMMQGGGHAAMSEQRLAQIKTQLKITAQQETVWQAFAVKVTRLLRF